MELRLIPSHLQQKYRFKEREHAGAILTNDFPDEFVDILHCLDTFCLRCSYIAIAGGLRSLIPIINAGFLRNSGWREKSWLMWNHCATYDITEPFHGVVQFTPELWEMGAAGMA